MNKELLHLPEDTLGMLLDALNYYIKNSAQRKAELVQLMNKYEDNLDYYVVMAQLDTNMIEMRDKINVTSGLLQKKIDCFEEYSKIAVSLYEELFAYIMSKR